MDFWGEKTKIEGSEQIHTSPCGRYKLTIWDHKTGRQKAREILNMFAGFSNVTNSIVVKNWRWSKQNGQAFRRRQERWCHNSKPRFFRNVSSLSRNAPGSIVKASSRIDSAAFAECVVCCCPFDDSIARIQM
jgi:hypothetical protein